MSPREARAATFLSGFGLKVEKVAEGATKTADFRVTASDQFDFHGEVKAIEGPGQDKPMTWDSICNRIGSDIRKAVAQFDAVNPSHSAPNVLIFLAEDMRIHWRLMKDFFEGKIEIEGQTIADLTRHRFGRVRQALPVVDLFILLDTGDNLTLFFTGSDPTFLPKLATLFNLRVETEA